MFMELLFFSKVNYQLAAHLIAAKNVCYEDLSAFRFSAIVFLVTFWSKMSYAYLWKGIDALSTGEGFNCLSPASKLKIAVLFCSIYKKTISFSAIVF